MEELLLYSIINKSLYKPLLLAVTDLTQYCDNFSTVSAIKSLLEIAAV
jgi:hypothetical protein